MITQHTKGSDVNVYIEAAITLGLGYEILSQRNPTVIISDDSKDLLFRSTSPSFNSLAGHQVARDKYMTAKLLKRVGVPVPKQKIFPRESISEIVEYAEENFPVVLKRNNGGQGNDVHVDLSTSKEVLIAIDEILKGDAKGILVEKYVEGSDYRIIVFRGEVIDIIERVPAFIVGDGKSTIKELINQKNRQRQDLLGGYPIKVDSILKTYIKKLKLSFDYVLPSGKKLTVNKSCNYSSGGETRKVQLENVHSDNIQLFKQIQKHSFLEYIGIDLITKDISKSWKENDAAINEINSTIGIDTHYYADMKEDLSAPIKVLKMYFDIT